MTSITFNVPNDEIANKIISAMRELGIETKEEAEMTLADFEEYLYNGDENAKTAERLAVLRAEKKLSLRKLSELTVSHSLCCKFDIKIMQKPPYCQFHSIKYEVFKDEQIVAIISL